MVNAQQDDDAETVWEALECSSLGDYSLNKIAAECVDRLVARVAELEAALNGLCGLWYDPPTHAQDDFSKRLRAARATLAGKNDESS